MKQVVVCLVVLLLLGVGVHEDFNAGVYAQDLRPVAAYEYLDIAQNSVDYMSRATRLSTSLLTTARPDDSRWADITSTRIEAHNALAVVIPPSCLMEFHTRLLTALALYVEADSLTRVAVTSLTTADVRVAAAKVREATTVLIESELYRPTATQLRNECVD